MNGYIFDWEENCKQILNGLGYTTKSHQTYEQIMLFRYLIDKGFSKDQIESLWVKTNSLIVQKTEGDIQERNRWFGRILEAVSKKKIEAGNTIKIYKEEIDFINGIIVSKWIKQYILAMLCVYKYCGKEWCKYDNKIKRFCYSITDTKKERESNSLMLSRVIGKYNLYEINQCFNTVSFKMNIKTDNKKLLLSLSNPREIEKILPFIKNEKVCAECGEVFEYNNHNSHLNICPKCYKRYRNSTDRSKKKSPSSVIA